MKLFFLITFSLLYQVCFAQEQQKELELVEMNRNTCLPDKTKQVSFHFPTGYKKNILSYVEGWVIHYIHPDKGTLFIHCGSMMQFSFLTDEKNIVTSHTGSQSQGTYQDTTLHWRIENVRTGNIGYENVRKKYKYLFDQIFEEVISFYRVEEKNTLRRRKR